MGFPNYLPQHGAHNPRSIFTDQQKDQANQRNLTGWLESSGNNLPAQAPVQNAINTAPTLTGSPNQSK